MCAYFNILTACLQLMFKKIRNVVHFHDSVHNKMCDI
jgi:hypothetical protein